jgi:hypothetical protein
VNCPVCGVPVEMPVTETAEADGMLAVVVTDPGTAWAHVRDAHPEEFTRMCEARRKMNANEFIGAMPRKVDGTFLRPGEDVADIAVRPGQPGAG